MPRRLLRLLVAALSFAWATAASAGQKLPAIYALDMGYWIADPVGRMLSTSGGMRPAYVIAIGYLPGQERARNVDLVQTSSPRTARTSS
jgi:hypothetical protein